MFGVLDADIEVGHCILLDIWERFVGSASTDIATDIACVVTATDIQVTLLLISVVCQNNSTQP